ncbi:hydrogen peroxide-inducible genes activator [Epibacterium sp. Ofav1-8]|uniref:hydrogen peroxide-inducible genes activator n=1 Tax=Epibacterium sp. Ofav1-8 TaxID=2917735 RepID=UPI001EF604D5|nr:hydrogen peroxide-inducible genes activator [Epibacterium sp. Ofav1-8]MCG7625043.1 hydrogen peroxide-inducible genes activator [Epibacterium sp. Ofav1-8]
MPELSLRHLRYFVVLSRALQYRRAARQLGISQPSLSLQIAALEEIVGSELVERRRNGLILTATGRDIATRAERILADCDLLVNASATRLEGLTGTLRLGSSPTIGPYILPQVLKRLHEVYPEFKLIIRDGPSRELLDDLAAGKHDLILTQAPVLRDDIHFHPLFREPLYLVVPRDHPLAEAGSAHRRELGLEQFLSLNPAYSLRNQVEALARSVGARMRDDIDGTSLDAIRQMVALGMGVTVLPRSYTQSEIDNRKGDVCVVHLKPGLDRQVGLAWRVSSGNPASFLQLAEAIAVAGQRAHQME